MPNSTIAQTEVLARIDQERAWWEGLLAEVGEERMEQRGATGDWTFKDVVAHLSGWQRRTLDRLQAARHDQPVPQSPWPAEFDAIEDEDESVQRINDWLYERNRDRLLAEVLAQSRGQWDELREIVASLPEPTLNDPTRFPGLDGESLAQSVASGSLLSHFHEEHEPTIRTWLDTAGSA
ncbi:MAG: hypothetical protein QOF33_2162 [Thermomicrobiales bacterium]|jgi:hypothetical protein|nr:hypothetical protein [Thermomicrobiales bacterium]